MLAMMLPLTTYNAPKKLNRLLGALYQLFFACELDVGYGA